MQNPVSNRKLRSLYLELVSEAGRHRIPTEDAQELANDTLLVVTDTFDESRGRLVTYARHVLLNKIRNFIRDRKAPHLLPDNEEMFIEDKDPESILTRAEDIELTKRMRNLLLKKLDAGEAEFLLQFEVVLDELEHRAVSETARRLNLTPQEGHNIIQRIERKAKALLKQPRVDALPSIPEGVHEIGEMDWPAFIRKIGQVTHDDEAAYSRILPSAPEFPLTIRIARSGLRDSNRGLEHFLSSLNGERREKLLRLLT
jgi:DNA-directed RNA polymerase specialized sigma24 family protein